MSKIKEDELTCTAYHEAGHAVAQFELDHALERVSIVPDEDRLGYCQAVPDLDFHPDANVGSIMDGKVVDAMMVCMAGPMAEEKFSGRRNDQGGRKDNQKVDDLVAYVTPSSEEGRDFHKWVRGRTKRMLGKWWPQVTAVAEALLKNKEMERDEITAVMLESSQRQIDEMAKNREKKKG